MGAGGRPTKLTPEIQEQIVQVIRMGNYVETAAAFAGIEKKTLYNWMKRGREAKSSRGIYAEFLHAVEKALAESEAADLALIGRAAETQWQAAAWRLERKFPGKWGRGRRPEDDDEELSRLAKREALLRVQKLEAEIAALEGTGAHPEADAGFMDALESQVDPLWSHQDMEAITGGMRDESADGGD